MKFSDIIINFELNLAVLIKMPIFIYGRLKALEMGVSIPPSGRINIILWPECQQVTQQSCTGWVQKTDAFRILITANLFLELDNSHTANKTWLIVRKKIPMQC